jgi:hypothetical protein
MVGWDAQGGTRTTAPRATDKVCVVCGRHIAWRAKWARDWEQVRHCSTAYRSRGLGVTISMTPRPTAVRPTR